MAEKVSKLLTFTALRFYHLKIIHLLSDQLYYLVFFILLLFVLHIDKQVLFILRHEKNIGMLFCSSNLVLQKSNQISK